MSGQKGTNIRPASRVCSTKRFFRKYWLNHSPWRPSQVLRMLFRTGSTYWPCQIIYLLRSRFFSHRYTTVIHFKNSWWQIMHSFCFKYCLICLNPVNYTYSHISSHCSCFWFKLKNVLFNIGIGYHTSHTNSWLSHILFSRGSCSNAKKSHAV